MTEKAWKLAERLVAKAVGGERVPITGRQRGDVPDVEHDWLAIEVKRRNVPKWIEEGHLQAVAAKLRTESKGGKGQLPVVIIKQPRKHTSNAFVVLQLADFIEWFGNVPREAMNAVEVFDELDGHD